MQGDLRRSSEGKVEAKGSETHSWGYIYTKTYIYSFRPLNWCFFKALMHTNIFSKVVKGTCVMVRGNQILIKAGDLPQETI